MGYGPPNWSSKVPITAVALQKISDSIDWHHHRIPFVFDDAGNIQTNANGLGIYVDYLSVDPSSYPSYQGHPGSWGQFDVSLPSNLFTALLSLSLQPASGSNGGLQATVSSEGADGFTVFVFDSGGTTITPFALWIMAIGMLAAGNIP